MSDRGHHKHSKHHHKKEGGTKLTDTQKSSTTSIFEDLDSAKRMTKPYMDKSEILEQRNPLSDIEAIPKPTDYSSTAPEYYKILNQQNQQTTTPAIPSIPISAANSNPIPNPYPLYSNYDINPTQYSSNHHSDPYFNKLSPQYSTQIPPTTKYSNTPPYNHYSQSISPSHPPPPPPPPALSSFQPSVDYHPIDIDMNYHHHHQQQQNPSSSVFGFPYESAQPPKIQTTNHTPLSIRSRWSDIYRELDSFSNIINTFEYSLKAVNTSELGISSCFDKFHESMRKIKIQIQYIQHDVDEVMIHQAGLTEEINYLKIQIIEKQKQDETQSKIHENILQTKTLTLRRELETAETSKRILEKQLQDLIKQSTEDQLIRQQKERENNEFRQQMAINEQRLQGLTNEKNSLTNQLSELTLKLGEVERQARMTQASTSSIVTDYEVLKSYKSELEGEVLKLKNKIQEQSKLLSEKETLYIEESTKLRTTNDLLRQQINEKNVMIQNSQQLSDSEKQNYISQINDLNKKIIELSQSEEDSNTVNQLESMLQEYITKCNEYENQYNSLNDQYSYINDKYTNMLQSQNDLKSKIQQYEMRINELQSELQKEQIKSEELERQINSMTVSNTIMSNNNNNNNNLYNSVKSSPYLTTTRQMSHSNLNPPDEPLSLNNSMNRYSINNNNNIMDDNLSTSSSPPSLTSSVKMSTPSPNIKTNSFTSNNNNNNNSGNNSLNNSMNNSHIQTENKLNLSKNLPPTPNYHDQPKKLLQKKMKKPDFNFGGIRSSENEKFNLTTNNTTSTTKTTPSLGSFQNNLNNNNNNNNNGIKPYSASTGSFAIKPSNTFSGGNIYGPSKILSSTSNDTLKKILDDDDDF